MKLRPFFSFPCPLRNQKLGDDWVPEPAGPRSQPSADKKGEVARLQGWLIKINYSASKSFVS